MQHTLLSVFIESQIVSNVANMYRGENKGLFVLLSRTQAGPGRTVKQEQEEISCNHVHAFIYPSAYMDGVAALDEVE